MIEVAGNIRDRHELPPDCEAVRDLIYAQAEGEQLTAEELRTLDDHASHCGECQAELKRVKNFTTNLSDLLRTLKPAQDLRDKVLQKIEAGAARKQSYRPVIALGAAIFFALLVLYLSHGGPAARITSYTGIPRILRIAGGEHRTAPFTETLINGDRLELQQNEAVTIESNDDQVIVSGPALVQFDVARGSLAKIHVLAQTSLSARTGAGALIIRAGQIFVRSSKAEFEMHVDRAGVCRVTSRSGRIYLNTPQGNTNVRPGASRVLGQDGLPTNVDGSAPE